MGMWVKVGPRKDNMDRKLIDSEASLDVDDDGDIFIELIFPNWRMGITLGHTLDHSGLFIVGDSHQVFRPPQSDKDMDALREALAKQAKG